MRVGLLACLLWLSGCASQTRMLATDCLATEEPRLAGQFTLVVEREQLIHRLLVVNQWHHGQLQVVGFNPVGAKLFQGRLENGQVTVESSRLYRGPAAESLIWGLLVHQLRESLPACWPPLQLETQRGILSLRQGGKLIYSGVAPNRFALPAEDVSVRIKRLN